MTAPKGEKEAPCVLDRGHQVGITLHSKLSWLFYGEINKCFCFWFFLRQEVRKLGAGRRGGGGKNIALRGKKMRERLNRKELETRFI